MENHISLNITLGILGGGQLGKMLTDITRRWDIRTHILDPNNEAPAKNSCNQFMQGDLMDYDTVLKFGKTVDILTIEIEHVNINALYELEKSGIIVYPKPEILDIIQNKQTQKAFFKEQKIPTAPFVSLQNKKELKTKVNAGMINFPCIWKAACFGYDGFGVKKLKSKTDINLLPDQPCIIESLIPINEEIAIIAARNKSGDVALYPPVGMTFDHEANQVEYVYYPSKINNQIIIQALKISKNLINSWKHIGLLAIEFFVDDKNQLLVNEVAPRPHNSGHLTIEGCETSQFEQHIRAIFDAPLGRTAFHKPTIMANIVGPSDFYGSFKYLGIDTVLKTPGAGLHVYGKKTTKPKRKMGHITLTGNKLESIFKKIIKLKSVIKLKEN
jgi:5-(carboxyamino)imidazole ribonucleotide synthase